MPKMLAVKKNCGQLRSNSMHSPFYRKKLSFCQLCCGVPLCARQYSLCLTGEAVNRSASNATDAGLVRTVAFFRL